MKRILLAIVALTALITAQAQVKWHTVDEAAAARIGNRIYLVDFYTTWCKYCKLMDRNTFTDATVAKLLNTYYYPVKFDAESGKPVRWAGRTYQPVSNGRDRIHEFAAGVRGFPTYRLYRADGTSFQDIPGYYDAKEFAMVLWYFASGDCDRYAFEQYRKVFDKEIRPQMEEALKTK